MILEDIGIRKEFTSGIIILSVIIIINIAGIVVKIKIVEVIDSLNISLEAKDVI